MFEYSVPSTAKGRQKNYGFTLPVDGPLFQSRQRKIHDERDDDDVY